jgi:uncharacterized radical SAM superfamily Fe-S cluster-containing enzyme
MSPFFIQAVRYARSIGFNSVQAATNGIEFAKNKKFAEAAADAGLRYAYLQFDGIGNAPNSHRKVGNLFDVKLKAIENMHTAGTEIILVTTLVNNVNNEEVGPIIRFAMDNPGKIAFIAFQPVSFTGRDEEITDERRLRQRYTLSHLARDVKQQVGITEPNRDWFPISIMSSFADAADVAHGPQSTWGQVSCGCHPNCGVGTALMINKQTKEMAPVAEFINVPQFVQDIRKITDSARSAKMTNFQMGLALLKNYRPEKAPSSFSLFSLLTKFDKSFGLSGKNYGKGVARRNDPWNFLFVAGMWFQDLFNYDFRRTEMCIIPYGTQEGEISFCAYNTGLGWRNIVEEMHKTATLTKWYEEHGRHQIYAGGKHVPLADQSHTLELNEEHCNMPAQVEEGQGPQTARDEKVLARDARQQQEMMKLYRQQVLKEQPGPDLIQITPAPSKPVPEQEYAHSGD